MNQFLTTVGKAISKLNPNEVRSQAERPVHIGLAANHEFRQAEMKRFLLPDGMSKQRMIESASHIHQINPEVTIPQFDVDMWEEGIAKGPQGFTFYPGATQRTIEQILDKKEDLGLPLARQFPAFRPAVVDKIIQGICQENAMFVRRRSAMARAVRLSAARCRAWRDRIPRPVAGSSTGRRNCTASEAP